MDIPPYVPQHGSLLEELLDRRAGSTLRWHTKLTLRPENIAEHQYFVACTGFILAVVASLGGVSVSPHDVVLLGLFHDSAEAITGDVPGSLKRINSSVSGQVRQWELEALPLLWTGLPGPLAEYLRHQVARFTEREDSIEWQIARFADLWCVYSFVHAEVEVYHNDALRPIRDQTALELYEVWNASAWTQAIARIDDSIGQHLRGVLVVTGLLTEVAK